MAISDTSGMSLYAKYKYMHYLERKITTKHDTDTYLQRPSILIKLRLYLDEPWRFLLRAVRVYAKHKMVNILE